MSGMGINPGQKVIALNVGSSTANGFTNQGWGYNQNWNSNWNTFPFFNQFNPYNPNNASFNHPSYSNGFPGGYTNTTNNSGNTSYNTGNQPTGHTGTSYTGNTQSNSSSNSYGQTTGQANVASQPNNFFGNGNFPNNYGTNNSYGYQPTNGFGNTYGYQPTYGYNNGFGFNGGGFNNGNRSYNYNVTPIAILTSIGINPDTPTSVQQFFTTLFNQFGINTSATFTNSFYNEFLNVSTHEHFTPKAILGLIGLNPLVAINPSNFFERILSHFGNPQVIFNPITFTSQLNNLFGFNSYYSSNNAWSNGSYYPNSYGYNSYPYYAANNNTSYNLNTSQGNSHGIHEVVVGEVVEATDNGFWIQGKTYYAVNFDGNIQYVAQSQYTTVRFVSSQGWEFLTNSSYSGFTTELYEGILNSNSFQPNDIGMNLLGTVPELIQTAYDLTNTITTALASSDLQSRQSIEALSAKVQDFMKNASEELRKVKSTQVPVHSA
ncbi:MAG: hypothetical protein RL885_27855 [Planctomycetota bacterium]